MLLDFSFLIDLHFHRLCRILNKCIYTERKRKHSVYKVYITLTHIYNFNPHNVVYNFKWLYQKNNQNVKQSY